MGIYEKKDRIGNETVNSMNIAVRDFLHIACAIFFAISPSFCQNSSKFEFLGRIRPRHAREILSSNWSIGTETLDRDYWEYDKAKNYLGLFGAKKARIQGGWAKCEKNRICFYHWLYQGAA